MLTILFITVFLCAYLGAGARIARARYALENHEYMTFSPTRAEATEEANRIKQKFAAMDHKSWCHLMYDILRKDGCTCHHSKQWAELKYELTNAMNGQQAGRKPASPIRTMLVWPGHLSYKYLTGGTVQKPNYALIAELESKELR